VHTLVRFMGLGLLFFSCAAAGYVKSALLKKRAAKLEGIYRSVTQLAAYILAERGELDRLIELCFDERDVHAENGIPILENAYLEKEDISLLNEFLLNLGTKDIKSEYERTVMYASLLEKQYFAAEERCKTLCRLYNAAGILCGAFVCIFLI